MALPAPKARYTFVDALSWDEDESIEIIDSGVFMMTTLSRIEQGDI